MVRIKHRYLLVNILYPDQESPNRQHGVKPTKDLPYTVQFRKPSSDQLNARLLARMIRDSILELFGDYGQGMIAASLQGIYPDFPLSDRLQRVYSHTNSQILLPSNQHSNHPRRPRTLPHGLGRSHLHHPAPQTRRPSLRDASRQGLWNYQEIRGGSYPAR